MGLQCVFQVQCIVGLVKRDDMLENPAVLFGAGSDETSPRQNQFSFEMQKYTAL